MDKLIEEIRKVVNLDNATELAITQKFKKEKFVKGELLLEEGNVCNNNYFIESGMLRQYMLISGQNSTKWFYSENQWATSHYSYFEQLPAFDYIEAYEDSIVYSISNGAEKDLLEYPQYLKYHVILLRHYLASLNYFMRNYKQMGAIEKYQFLIKTHPEILQRVKLKHVASLIGISQETLSRIRATI